MPIVQQVIRFIDRDKKVSKQQKDEFFIRQLSVKTKECLETANTHIKYNNFYAALDTYDRGIKFVESTPSMKHTSDYHNSVFNSKKKKNNNNDKSTSANKNNPTQQREYFLSTLKMEKSKALATLVQHSQQFHQSLPYDILYKIFGYLEDDFKNLYQCARVCTRWCQFLTTWPPFWNNSLPDKSTDTSDWPTIVVTMDQRKCYKAYVKKNPFDNEDARKEIKDILTLFLSISDDHNIEKLCFQNIRFSIDTANLLGKVLKRMKTPTFKHVACIGCDIPTHQFVSPVLTSCSNLTHITMIESDGPYFYNIEMEKNQLLTGTLPIFSALVYLKLFFHNCSRPEVKNINMLLSGDEMLLAKSPHLEHLFVTCDARYFKVEWCAETVLKHCPRLKNVILSNTLNKNMPSDIFLCGIDDDENNDIIDATTTTTTTKEKEMPHLLNKEAAGLSSLQQQPMTSSSVTANKGLRRFVIYCSPPETLDKHDVQRHLRNVDPFCSRSKIVIYCSPPETLDKHDVQRHLRNVDPFYSRPKRYTWERCFSMLNKFHQDALELLYIKWDVIAIKSLSMLRNDGIILSNLRELHLHDNGSLYNINALERIIGAIDKTNILEQLLPCLPALEALSICQSRPFYSYNKYKQNTCYTYSPGHLFVDDAVLVQLVKHCHRIRYIKIDGYPPAHTLKGVLLLGGLDLKLKNQPDPTSRKLPIAYLDMHITQYGTLLPLVKNLHSLNELHVYQYRDYYIENVDILSPFTGQQEIDAILHERGGSLKVSLQRLE